MNKVPKILGLLTFPILLGLIFYIAFSVDYEQPYKITLIEINNCEHLSGEKYFAYAGFDKKETYDELTLPVIKSRLEKHPYVKRADVLYVGQGKVEVTIYEKDFWAVLIAGGDEFILTRNFELLPVLPFTQQLLIPIITDKALYGKIKAFDNVKNLKELTPAYKLLDAAKMINPLLYDNISEIAFVGNNEMDVYFTFADYNLEMNRQNVVSRLYYFNSLWKYIKGAEICDKIEYIDLKYGNKIFLGLKNNASEGKKS